MRTGRIVITGAVALALVAGGTAAGAAITASPIDGSGVIDGCYSSKAFDGSHVFVLQDAGTNCPTGTTAISWNQQGPAGPQGQPGTTGPAGPSTAGSAGLDVVMVGSSGAEDATAYCPADHPFLTGGGGYVDGFAGNLVESTPIAATRTKTAGWGVSTLGGATVSVYAICSK